MSDRPQTTVILAMTADGKISDCNSTAARFGSSKDKAHLEQQIALVDGVLFGAGTLRAYGSSLPIASIDAIEYRRQNNLPEQPFHIVASASGKIDRTIPFFQQPIPRWLLTTTPNISLWQDSLLFDRLIPADTFDRSTDFDWVTILSGLQALGIKKLAVLGGGKLVASLLAINAIDELWLTVCPLILGGISSPTPVMGEGWLQSQAINLDLLSVERVNREIFLHYRVIQD